MRTTFLHRDGETLTDPYGREVTLNDLMEFDCPIRVHGDGLVTFLPDDAPSFTPEMFVDTDGADSIAGDPAWEPLQGFTGQYGYNGPVMHPSEYIGGGMADYILSTPGLYVAVVVNAYDDDGEQADEPAGWAVFTIRDETWEG